MEVFFSLAFCELIFSSVIIFLTIKIANKLAIYDFHDDRRMHKDNIPRLGGLGIFSGFAAVMALLSTGAFLNLQISGPYIVLLVSSAVVFLMGFLDDLRPWKARYKLLVQLSAGFAICAAGFRFNVISFSPLNLNMNLGIFSWVITVLWIAGIINVINMFDGLDGLAGTTSLIVLLSYTVFFVNQRIVQNLSLCFFVIPAVVAFLIFNLPFPKAKIFMGDGGSQFLGFILAVLPLLPSRTGNPSVPVWYAITFLVFPFCDAVAAVWRRVREHRSIMSPDFSHLHHKLVAIGFSQRQTLVLLVILQSAVALLVVTAYHSGGTSALAILLAIWLIAVLFFTIIHINKNIRFTPPPASREK